MNSQKINITYSSKHNLNWRIKNSIQN